MKVNKTPPQSPDLSVIESLRTKLGTQIEKTLSFQHRKPEEDLGE
jgi:hypothetical protein